MTVMHELGHLIFDRDRTTPIRGTRALEGTPSFPFRGGNAHSRPRRQAALAETLTLHGYLRVKADYRISAAALIVRAADLGVIRRSASGVCSSSSLRRGGAGEEAGVGCVRDSAASESGGDARNLKSARQVARTVGIRYADASRWTGLPVPDQREASGNVIPLRPVRKRDAPVPG
ncbi:MAG: hypothetical protein IPL43_06335 [Micropruina sp.]|nr:hypothetical protein [Micropruina sp.]